MSYGYTAQAQSSHYSAPPSYYTPSTVTTYPNPSSVQAPRAVDAYVPTSTAYNDPQYQTSAYSLSATTGLDYAYATYPNVTSAATDLESAYTTYPNANPAVTGLESAYATYGNATSASMRFESAYFGPTPAGATSNRYRPGLGFKEHNLATKKEKLIQGGTSADSVKVCTTCNVVCNSDTAFNAHITSTKHIAKVAGLSTNGLARMIGPNLKKKKKKAPITSGPKVAQSVYCEICKIMCNTLEMYNKHVAGKKHNKHIKEATLAVTFTAGTSKAIQFVPASNNTSDNNDGNNSTITNNNNNNNIIAHHYVPKVAQQPVYCDVCNITCDTQEVFDKHVVGKKHVRKTSPTQVDNENGDRIKRKEKSVSNQNIELKKRKLVENGTSVVKVCDLCNVVCNSQTVFDFHVRGQMHIGMLKKQENLQIQAPTGTVATTNEQIDAPTGTVASTS